MNERERDELIEASVTAHRDVDREGRLVPPPAWWDLSPEDADELFRRQVAMRRLEKAASPEGWTTTMLAVMRKI